MPKTGIILCPMNVSRFYDFGAGSNKNISEARELLVQERFRIPLLEHYFLYASRTYQGDNPHLNGHKFTLSSIISDRIKISSLPRTNVKEENRELADMVLKYLNKCFEDNYLILTSEDLASRISNVFLSLGCRVRRSL